VTARLANPVTREEKTERPERAIIAERAPEKEQGMVRVPAVVREADQEQGTARVLVAEQGPVLRTILLDELQKNCKNQATIPSSKVR
jgi:hypothetical protein